MPQIIEKELAFRQELEKKHGQVWTKDELLAEFEITGFSFGIVVVKRNRDGQIGSMDFSHLPRFYHSFQEHN